MCVMEVAFQKSNNMVRIDVYYVPGEGYYWVPIYVADTVKSTLPNKAVLRNKGMDDWKEMNEKDFQFSLYNNDLVFIERDSPINFSLTNEKALCQANFPQREHSCIIKKEIYLMPQLRWKRRMARTFLTV